MISKEIPTKKNINDVDKFIDNLEKRFPNWVITDMGGLSSYPDSSHFHIKSANPREKGVLEITLGPSFPCKVLVKIANNRNSEWALRALKNVEKYLSF